MTHRILLTGASGMLGSRAALALCEAGHTVIGVDVAEDRVIHLAALAHVTNETDLSWSRYFRMNVLISQHVFENAARLGIPVFFSSTVDVYGIPVGPINEATPPAPVGGYARSKYEAEQRLLKLMGDTPAFIARFAPVYSADDMHDVQKRYYLKYPSVAFTVGTTPSWASTG